MKVREQRTEARATLTSCIEFHDTRLLRVTDTRLEATNTIYFLTDRDRKKAHIAKLQQTRCRWTGIHERLSGMIAGSTRLRPGWLPTLYEDASEAAQSFTKELVLIRRAALVASTPAANVAVVFGVVFSFNSQHVVLLARHVAC